MPVVTNEIPMEVTVLMKKDNELWSNTVSWKSANPSLGANAARINAMPSNTLFFQNREALTFFQNDTPCSDYLFTLDKTNAKQWSGSIFSDKDACNIDVSALAYFEDTLVVGYSLNTDGKQRAFFLRYGTWEQDVWEFNDLILDQKPIQILPMPSGIAVLGFDVNITDENSLIWLDNDFKIRFQKNLGYDVGQLLPKNDNALIASYPELHATIELNSMEVAYTRYDKMNTPRLDVSPMVVTGKNTTVFYTLGTEGEESTVSSIPASYDFETNRATRYYYENFLTEEELSFELDIAETTALHYDSTNEVLLVGFKKSGDNSGGGILRIQLEPQFRYIDFIALDGIPISIQ